MRTFTLAQLAALVTLLAVISTVGCRKTENGGSTDAAKTDGAQTDGGTDGTEAPTGELAELLKDLQSDDDEKQKLAAAQIGRMGAAAAPAVDALVEQLEDNDPHVRAHAARALGLIGKNAMSAIDALARAIGDEDQAVRREALLAMKNISPGDEKVVGLMIEALGKTSGATLAAAIDSLAAGGADIVPPMIKAMDDDRTRFWALLVLQEVGPDAKDAVPVVTEALEHEHGEVRHQAAMVLRAIGPDAAPAVPALTKGLQSEDKDQRVACALALGSIGAESKDSLDELKAFAASEHDLTRVVVAWAIQKIDPNEDQLRNEVVPVLFESLKNEDPVVRRSAALGLLDIKPSEIIGEDAVAAAFDKAIEGASPEAIEDMLNAVAAMGAKAVPAMIKGLKHPQLCRPAAEIIARIGPDAAEAVPTLIEALGNEDPVTRREVLFALAQIGAAAKDAAPHARKIISDETAQEENRITAIYLLGKIGPDAATAVEDLQVCMGGDTDSLSRVCAWALVRIQPDNEAVIAKSIPFLIKALENTKEEFVVGEVAHTLTGLGPKAKDALPALKAWLDKADNPLLRETIEEAIKSIEGSGGN